VNRTGALGTVLLVGGSLMLGLPAPAQSARFDPARASEELNELDGELKRLEAQHREKPDVFGAGRVMERLGQAQLFYLIAQNPGSTPEVRRENLNRASLLLAEVVESPKIQASPEYPEALFILGESLYLQDNLRAAQRYYGELLGLGSQLHFEQAILRLIDISSRTGRYDDFDRHIARYVDVTQGKIPNQVQYLRAKARFFQKQDDDAEALLNGIPLSDPYGLRARYLRGAIQTRKGDLKEAARLFTTVSKSRPKSARDRAVIEMAHLARGRLAYEEGDITGSLNSYQDIPFDSPIFPETLYEITWAFIRRGQLIEAGELEEKLPKRERPKRARAEYAKALENLDMLLALEHREDKRPGVLVLMGNLHLQRAEFDEAEMRFEKLLEDFEPTYVALQQLRREASDPAALLEDILRVRDGGAAVGSALPPLAVRWAAQNADVIQVLSVFQDMRTSQQELEETQAILGKLERVLDRKNPEDLFAPLKSGVNRSRQVENRLLSILGRVTDAQRAALPRIQSADAAELKRLRAERGRWQEKLDNLPKGKGGYEKLRKSQLAQIRSVEGALQREVILFNGWKARMVADIQFLQAPQTRASRGPEWNAAADEKIQETQAMADALAARMDALRAEIKGLRDDLAMVGATNPAEARIREAYNALVQKEGEIIARAQGEGAGSPQLTKLSRIRNRATGLRGRNQAFLAHIRGQVSEQLAVMRRVVDEERLLLAQYATALKSQTSSADTLAQEAARLAVEHVLTDFDEIVVKGDVGIADTAFQRKHVETKKIGELERGKARELTDLNRAYADLERDDVQ
jgi:tetratricopeptide (TPR) repeat protein